MITLYKQALKLQNFLIKNNWKFCFIGGIALQRWGEPRLTVDIDITLLTGFGNEEYYIDKFLKYYNGRIPDTKPFALKNRVLLLHSSDKIDIDVALGCTPFEELVISRATNFSFLPEVSLLTCSAEDLVVLKSFADRSRDWSDVEGIVIRQGKKLDFKYIQKQLAPLCELKNAPDIMQKVKTIFNKFR